jgi:hypothetical protein
MAGPGETLASPISPWLPFAISLWHKPMALVTVNVSMLPESVFALRATCPAANTSAERGVGGSRVILVLYFYSKLMSALKITMAKKSQN